MTACFARGIMTFALSGVAENLGHDHSLTDYVLCSSRGRSDDGRYCVGTVVPFPGP